VFSYEYGYELAGIIIAFLIFTAAWLVPQALMLLTLRKLLSEVSPENRAMAPGLVWLGLVPVFNLVWLFIIVRKVRRSVRAEFRMREWPPRGDYGYVAGAIYPSALVVGTALRVIDLICVFAVRRFEVSAGHWALVWIGNAGILIALVCFIVYWVKCAQLRKYMMLQKVPPYAPWGPGPNGAAGQYAGPGADTGSGPHEAPMSYGPSGPEVISAGQAQQRFCTSCGAANQPDAAYCLACGKPVA
jgi:ribosomal protein L40E